MPQKPAELDPTANALAFFGAELRHHRGRAKISQDLLGERVYCSGSLIGYIEVGSRMPTQEFAQSCDEVLGTGGALGRLWHLVSRESYPSWFQPFVELEREATTLREFMPLAVPGLLQTEEYAQAVIRTGRPDYSDEQVEELVAGRMERQHILDRADPPLLILLIDESVLTRTVGGPGIMRAQLDALLDAARRPRVVLQIVPTSAGADAGLAGTFVVASFTDSSDVVYFEAGGTGQVVDRPDEVMASAVAYDVLRAEALPQAASLDLIRKTKGELHDG